MMKNARRMLALAVALMLALLGLAMAEEGEWAVEAECAVEAPLAEELEEALDTEGGGRARREPRRS